MPRALPSNAETWLAKRGVIDRPVILADIQTLDGTAFFWSDVEGVYPTLLPVCTRIQSSGGATSVKYYYAGPTGAAGDRIHQECNVTNNGTTDITVNVNGGSPGVKTLAPGSTARIVYDYVLSGVFQIQFVFNTANIGDTLDIFASGPLIMRNGVDLQANRDFTSGAVNGGQWTVHDTAAVTLTQSVTGPKFYNGWIKGGFNFTVAKDFSTNAGDLLLQNLSGNTIERDVALAVKLHELEGALCIVRLWLPLLDASMNEFHCSISEQNPKEQEAGARCLQIFDPSQYSLAGDIVSTLCTWRFKSLPCGSTGTATACSKRFTDCQDPTRAAAERFHAVLTTLPNTLTQPIAGQGGGRLPPDDDGGGLRRRRHGPVLE